MPIQVLMPALSPTMEKGNLAKWLKKEGEAVKSGDVIAEIETDKATMEVEAVDEGTLGKILVPEGTNDVAVNTPIAMRMGRRRPGRRRPRNRRLRQQTRKLHRNPLALPLHPNQQVRPRLTRRYRRSPMCPRGRNW